MSPLASDRIGIVTGLRAEARIARKRGWDTETGGGTQAGAARAAEILVARGATALISFGLAGGLDPSLAPGTILIPRAVICANTLHPCDPALAETLGGMTDHILLGGAVILATAAKKSRAWQQTQAHAIDLESAAVAAAARAHNLPFAILRAICDPAWRNLPPAALLALHSDGAISLPRILGSLLRAPGQLPALLALARDAAHARRALVTAIARIA